jgi:hypothetical protein
LRCRCANISAFGQSRSPPETCRRISACEPKFRSCQRTRQTRARKKEETHYPWHRPCLVATDCDWIRKYQFRRARVGSPKFTPSKTTAPQRLLVLSLISLLLLSQKCC